MLSKLKNSPNSNDLLVILYLEKPTEERLTRVYKAYERLVHQVARDTHYKVPHINLDDLVTEGFIACKLALDRFDPSKGFKFSTYVVGYMKGKMQHYVRDLGSSIREPALIFDMKQKERKAREHLSRLGNHQPTNTEVANVLNIPVHKYEKFLQVKVVSILSMDAPSHAQNQSRDNSSYAEQYTPLALQANLTGHAQTDTYSVTESPSKAMLIFNALREALWNGDTPEHVATNLALPFEEVSTAFCELERLYYKM